MTMKLSKAISLHGAAYLALDAWVKEVLGQDYIDQHDELFGGGVFYPPELVRLAQGRMNEEWVRQRPEKP